MKVKSDRKEEYFDCNRVKIKTDKMEITINECTVTGRITINKCGIDSGALRVYPRYSNEIDID